MKGKTALALVLVALALSISLAPPEAAAVTYTFDSNPPPDWGNERGNWVASGGQYNAQSPNNNPPTYSSLPFELTDFTFEVDINNIYDGGIWLRSNFNGNQASGILLVAAHSNLYWHTINNDSVTGTFNEVYLGLTNANARFRVVVSGSHYAAYVNNELKTTLDNSQFSSGRVGLYDYSGQTFDNASLVPIPGALLLFGSGLLGLAGWRKFRN